MLGQRVQSEIEAAQADDREDQEDGTPDQKHIGIAGSCNERRQMVRCGGIDSLRHCAFLPLAALVAAPIPKLSAGQAPWRVKSRSPGAADAISPGTPARRPLQGFPAVRLTQSGAARRWRCSGACLPLMYPMMCSAQQA